MITIGTFNVRYDTPKDGVNAFSFRISSIIDMLRSERPDVLGLQEVKDAMLRDLAEALPEYAFLGCGRDADYTGEHCLIACRRDTVEVHAFDTFQLSPTPFVPGSRFADQSDCPRICTHARLFHRAERVVFRVFNTHLDHQSERARAQGLSLVLSVMGELDGRRALPAFLTGDFNLEPVEAPYALPAASSMGLRDLTAGMEPTYHGFGEADPFTKIDYIFTNRPAREFTVAARRTTAEGRFLSDHDAIFASWTNP